MRVVEQGHVPADPGAQVVEQLGHDPEIRLWLPGALTRQPGSLRLLVGRVIGVFGAVRAGRAWDLDLASNDPVAFGPRLQDLVGRLGEVPPVRVSVGQQLGASGPTQQRIDWQAGRVALY